MKGSLQIKNGKYYAVFRINGKQKWVNLNIPSVKGNKRKAEQAMQKILVEYTDNISLRSKILFSDYVLTWLENVKNNIDSITYDGYKQDSEKHIIPYFKNKRTYLDEMTIADIEEYYIAKATSGRLDGKPGGLSLNTIRLHKVVISSVLKYALRENLVKDNPCNYAKLPTSVITVQKHKPAFYNANQCKVLLEKVEGTPLYAMIYITFMYGLRRSELLGLKWNAVDFTENTIKIQHTVVLNSSVVKKDKTKNASSRRTYPLLPDIRKILEDMLKVQKTNKMLFGNCYEDNDYVFVREDGKLYYPSYPSHELRKVLKRNDLPYIRWHDLRHSTASMLIEKKWHMKDISEWLGHSEIGTTMNIYGHISMEHKRELGNSLGNIL